MDSVKSKYLTKEGKQSHKGKSKNYGHYENIIKFYSTYGTICRIQNVVYR